VESWFNSWHAQEIFYSSSEAHSVPTSEGTRGMLKQLRHDVGHSAQSTTKIRMSGVIHHFPFMICTDIFTFTQGIGKIICMYIRISTAAEPTL